MSRYVLLLVWIGFCAILSLSGRFYRREMVNGAREIRFEPWFAVMVMVPLVVVAAMRGDFQDTGIYLAQFRSYPTVVSGIIQATKEAAKDRGFTFLSCLIKVFITENTRVYMGIIAVLHAGLITVIFRKYSPQFLVSIFLFIASSDYASWMLNGLRQFMAVSIIFVATPLVLKKKYFSLLLVVLLASTMHKSALLMIPLILIALGKPWNRRTLLFIVLILLAIVFVGRFTTFLDDTLVGTQYSNVVSDYTASSDNGTNPIRVIVYAIPAVIAFITRHTIDRANDKFINYCPNMSIISAGLYLISMVTSGIYLGRLPIYASLYGYILLPWEMENLFSLQSKRFLYFVLILAYLVFYYYQMHLIWGLF